MASLRKNRVTRDRQAGGKLMGDQMRFDKRPTARGGKIAIGIAAVSVAIPVALVAGFFYILYQMGTAQEDANRSYELENIADRIVPYEIQDGSSWRAESNIFEDGRRWGSRVIYTGTLSNTEHFPLVQENFIKVADGLSNCSLKTEEDLRCTDPYGRSMALDLTDSELKIRIADRTLSFE